MNENIERNMGEQPIKRTMDELGITTHDMVAASEDHLTHKMVARARKGRRLTPNTKKKVVLALNTVSKRTFTDSDLFNY